jgi:lipoate-protein ligase A
VAETWRFVDLGAVDAFENNAQMAVLSRSTREQDGPIFQTSVWGVTHLNVGWFDDVDTTVDLDACQRLGVPVIRRPFAGGGTAFYDAGCAAMWGVLFPAGAASDLDALTARLQAVVLAALARLGLGEVRFDAADLRWERGRKLGGVSAGDFGAVVSVGGFLNLRQPDLDLYLRVARIPDEKFRDKVVKDMAEYVCTAEEVAGRPVSYDDFRDALVGAVEATGVTLARQPLSDAEQQGLAKVSRKIADADELRRVSSERFRAAAPAGTAVGFGNHKGRKLVRAGVAVDEAGTIAAAMMAGDMHVAPPDTLDRIATALAGASASDPAELRARIAAVYEAPEIHRAETTAVTTDDFLTALRHALADAGAASPGVKNADRRKARERLRPEGGQGT